MNRCRAQVMTILATVCLSGCESEPSLTVTQVIDRNFAGVVALNDSKVLGLAPNEIFVIDVTDPAAPTVASPLTHSLAVDSGILHEGTLYFYDAFASGKIYAALADTQQLPPSTELFELDHIPEDIAIQGDTIYSLNRIGGLVTVDLATGARIGEADTPLQVRSITVQGDLAVATSTLGNLLLDVSDPSDPQPITMFGPTDLEVVDAVFGKGGVWLSTNGDVLFYDLTNPTAPVEYRGIQSRLGPLLHYDDRLVVREGVWDVSDPMLPRRIAALDGDQTQQIARAGDAVVRAGSSFVEVITGIP